MSPPAWLRHVTPWWLLRLINRHSHTCWPRMVDWKLNGDDGWSGCGWRPRRTCWDGPEGGWDWCGRFTRREDLKPVGDDRTVVFR